MSRIILLICFLIICALINWKIPMKLVRIWETLIITCFFVILAFMQHLSPLTVYQVLPFSLIMLCAPILSFFASSYIQYRKNRTDMETIQKTLSQAIIALISTFALIILVIYHVFFTDFLYYLQEYYRFGG